jgi:hypothetical protein
MNRIIRFRRSTAIAAALLFAAIQMDSHAAPPGAGQPIDQQRMKDVTRPIPTFPTGVQPGQSYLWSRGSDVAFSPTTTSFSKQVMLPAGSWQITVQFSALLNDGFDNATNQIRNASLTCQIFGAGAATAQTLIATPALPRHPTAAPFSYTMTSTQPINLQYLYTSDGQANGSIALMCTPSARDNSIVMQKLTISAIPIPAVFAEQG